MLRGGRSGCILDSIEGTDTSLVVPAPELLGRSRPSAVVLSWSRLAGRPVRTLTWVWTACVAVFLISVPLPHADHLIVGSDGIGYFANLRSLVFDHDLNLVNDYRALTGFVPPHASTPKYSIGVALLWLPFYLVAHVLVLLVRTLGFGVSDSGYGDPYQTAVCLGTMVYGYVGLRLTYRLCRELFSNAAALGGTLVAWLGSGAVYYLVLENSMAHVLSIAAVTGLILWWRVGRDRSAWRYFGGMGALVGVAAMVRPQDAAFALLPMAELALRGLRAARPLDRVAMRRVLRDSAVFGCAAFLAYLPQFVTSWIVYGTPFGNGYSQRGIGFDFGSPHLYGTLFSSWHGLYSWHPVLLLATAGLILVMRNDRLYGLLLVIALAVQVYLVASWAFWWSADAFGSRLLLSNLPIFAVGMTAALAWLAAQRGGRTVVAVVATAALVWNGLFIIQFRGNFVSASDPLTFRQMTVDKLTVVPDGVRKLLERM